MGQLFMNRRQKPQKLSPFGLALDADAPSNSMVAAPPASSAEETMNHVMAEMSKMAQQKFARTLNTTLNEKLNSMPVFEPKAMNLPRYAQRTTSFKHLEMGTSCRNLLPSGSSKQLLPSGSSKQLLPSSSCKQLLPSSSNKQLPLSTSLPELEHRSCAATPHDSHILKSPYRSEQLERSICEKVHEEESCGSALLLEGYGFKEPPAHLLAQPAEDWSYGSLRLLPSPLVAPDRPTSSPNVDVEHSRNSCRPCTALPSLATAPCESACSRIPVAVRTSESAPLSSAEPVAPPAANRKAQSAIIVTPEAALEESSELIEDSPAPAEADKSSQDGSAKSSFKRTPLSRTTSHEASFKRISFRTPEEPSFKTKASPESFTKRVSHCVTPNKWAPNEVVFKSVTCSGGPRKRASKSPGKRFSDSPEKGSPGAEAPFKRSEKTKPRDDSLQAHLPHWWHPQLGVLKAADTFDAKLMTQSALSMEQLEEVEASEQRHGGEAHIRAYTHNLGRLRGHRFLVQPLRQRVPPLWSGSRHYPMYCQELELAREQSGPWELEIDERWEKEIDDDGLRSRRVRWRIGESIWATRKHTSNSKDYYETASAMRRMFEEDFDMALHDHGLERSLMHWAAVSLGDTTGKWRRTSGAYSREFDVKDRCDAVMDDVREALWDGYQLLYGIFDYYVVMHGSRSGAVTAAEASYYEMGFLPFTEMLKDAQLLASSPPFPHNGVRAYVLDLILTVVVVPNRQDEEFEDQLASTFPKLETKGLRQSERFLCRHQYLEALVRLAMERFVRTCEVHDVSDAIRAMCATLMEMLPPEVMQDSNIFRAQNCYNEQTDAVLRHYKESLVSLYEQYSAIVRNDPNDSPRLLSIYEFMCFVSHMGLIDDKQITQEEARLIFLWSRIRSVYGCAPTRAKMRLRHLLFEDFLEAVVRLSVTIALPSDSELALVGCPDAGTFLMMLREGPDEYADFIVAHRQEQEKSMDELKTEPRQHVSRCVHHFMSLVFKVIDANTKEIQSPSKKRGMLGAEEVSLFLTKCAEDGPITHKMESSRAVRLAMVKSVKDAHRLLRKKLRDAKIFSGLNHKEIDVLQSAMVNKAFQKGQDIITQGDLGDAFYVITSGDAEVLRINEEDLEDNCLQFFESQLGILHAFDYFGERALIKQEPRFATVRAMTDLEAVCITQSRFEKVFGRPLSEYIPDKY